MSDCPYKGFMNSIPFFGSKKQEIEEEVVTTLDTEKAMDRSKDYKETEMTECPFKNKKNDTQEKLQKETKCPINQNKDEDSDIEDNTRTGGCPVMNQSNQLNSLIFFQK